MQICDKNKKEKKKKEQAAYDGCDATSLKMSSANAALDFGD